jgi:putative membrane protein
MDEEPTRPDTSTALAKERTRVAADRTLMAWIRTALSLIAFGLGIGKAVELLDVAFPERASLLDPRHTTLAVAIGLVAVGVLSLVGAIIQHGLQLRALEQATYTYRAPLALSMVVAILLLVIGLLAVVALIITIP